MRLAEFSMSTAQPMPRRFVRLTAAKFVVPTPTRVGRRRTPAGSMPPWDLLRAFDPSEAPESVTASSPPTPTTPPDVDEFYLVEGAPADLLARLAEAGHEVGEVVFVDPHVGLLEIVVGDPPAVGQLAVAVGPPSREGTEVSFTLEPLGITPAPPIGPVVEALMAAVRR